MGLGVSYTIRSLAAGDSVKNFSAGSAEYLPLKSFLKNQAVEFHEAYITRTYVAIPLEECPETGVLIECSRKNVIGYISLITSEIDITNGYTVEDCTHANNYGTLPAIKIARLAVDGNCRRRGIGENLMAYAFAIATDVIAEHVGCRFLITDSKRNAISFYEKQGFILLDTEANRSVETPIMFVDLFKLREPSLL